MGRFQRVYSQIDGERQGGLGRGRGPDPPCQSPARSSEPDRDPCWLRYQPMRRLCRAYRWPGGQIRYGGKLDEDTVRLELEGNICRCTGYHNIVKSVLDAAGRMNVAQAAE